MAETPLKDIVFITSEMVDEDAIQSGDPRRIADRARRCASSAVSYLRQAAESGDELNLRCGCDHLSHALDLARAAQNAARPAVPPQSQCPNCKVHLLADNQTTWHTTDRGGVTSLILSCPNCGHMVTASLPPQEECR